MAVLDASVLVALLNEAEAGHAPCWAWLNAALDRGVGLNSPSILLPEAVAGACRGQPDRQAAAGRMVAIIQTIGLDFWPVSVPVAQRSAAIVAAQRIRGCDAVYVALAEQLGEPLITLDRQQAERAVALVAVEQLGAADPE